MTRAMREVVVKQRIGASRERVWALITHHQGMPDWTPLKRVTMDAVGSPDADGVGAIRRMMGAGPTILEEVMAWQPIDSYEYRLLKGAPIRDHRGIVSFADVGGGTEVTWHVRFRGAFPGAGWMAAQALRMALTDMLKRAKRHLEEG